MFAQIQSIFPLPSCALVYVECLPAGHCVICAVLSCLSIIGQCLLALQPVEAVQHSWKCHDMSGDAVLPLRRRNLLFKLQARYVAERQDPGLWAKVLSDENTYRRQHIDQVCMPVCRSERSAGLVFAFGLVFECAESASQPCQIMLPISRRHHKNPKQIPCAACRWYRRRCPSQKTPSRSAWL